jgi:glyoxylase-like metal-dependent hydrolase (beta-lactamase superfamily II)
MRTGTTNVTGRSWRLAGGALALSAATWVGAAAQAQDERPLPRSGNVQVLPVQGNVYMIAGAGGNIAASVGPNGVLLVDTGSAAASADVLAVVRALSPNRPIQFIVNTHFKERTGGNEALAKAGRRVVDDNSNQAVVLAHEAILNRMSAPSGGRPARPTAAWPTDTFFTGRKEVTFNGEPVILHHRPGETDGDTYVFFRKSDVVATGSLYINTTFPKIDVEAGGHINGVIEGLNDIIDLIVPLNNAEDGTLVIPGEGRLADELDVAEYRDMVTIMRDRVQAAIKRGRTLEQVRSDKGIALEYEARYGGKGGPWTTEMFLAAVYRNLSGQVAPVRRLP